MKKKNNKIVLFIICIGLLLISIGTGFVVTDMLKDNKSDTNKKEKEPVVVEKEPLNQNGEKFDFNEINNNINTALRNNAVKIYRVKCTDLSSNGNIETQNDFVMLNNIVSKIIDMLKKADSFEEDITFSFMGCTPKNVQLIIGEKNIYDNVMLRINYSDSGDTLLISYNNKGYAFKYQDSKIIENFIENLDK